MGRLNNHFVYNGDIEVQPTDFPAESNSESVPDPETALIKSMDDNEMTHILKLFYSLHDDYLLDADLQMIQDLLVVAPPSKIYTLSTVLCHKYGGTNFSIKILISQFSIFVPTKATVELSNGNTGHFRIIGIILCCFPNCTIICLVEPVYYFPGHPYNTISSGNIKFMFVFRRLHLTS